MTNEGENDKRRYFTLGLGIVLLAILSGCTMMGITPSPNPNVRQITSGSFKDLNPAWSPNGQTVIFQSTRDNRVAQPSGAVMWDIYTVTPSTKKIQQITDNRTDIAYNDGFVNPYFVNSTSILAYEMNWIHEFMLINIQNPPVYRLIGDGSEPNFQRLLYIPGGYGGNRMVVAPDGRTVVWRERVTPNSNLPKGKYQLRMAPITELEGQSAAEAGQLIFETFDDGMISGMAFSPDGEKLVFSCARNNFISRDVGEDLFILDLTTKQLVQLTFDGIQGVRNTHPDWGTNNKIVFSSTRNNNQDIYLISSDGSNLTRVTTDPAADVQPSWSPDATKIVFSSNRGGKDVFNLFVLYTGRGP